MLSAERKLQINESKASRFDFDTVASRYDSWYAGRRGAMYDRLEKKLITDFLPVEAEDKKLLEIGCGTGHWSRFFSEYGFDVIGIDVSERMINIAENKNIPNASFRIGDGHCLPFEDCIFDVTAAITTLEFVHDAEVVVQEMVRCTCKPGGRLLIGVLNELARLNRNRKQKPESPYVKARLFSPRELKQLLVQYGEACVVTAGFTPRQKHLLPLSPLIDTVGRLLHIPYGAFIAAEVRL